MDSQTIVFVFLFLAVTTGFVLLLALNSRADRVEKEILNAARQSGWKVGKQQFSGTGSTGAEWTLETNNPGATNSLYWHSENVRLNGGVLVVVPRLMLQVFSGKSSKMAFRLTGSGRSWLRPGLKTLQLAIEKSQAVDAGSERFQQRYCCFSNLPEVVKGILSPEVEALLMDFPAQPGQPFTPVYIVLSSSSLRVFAETSLQTMKAFTCLVDLGITLSAKVNTLQDKD
ncbi:MAG TPA: hypothetical protein PLI60_06175 [Anaerolineaceae bacterium]|nr:hypothetical protein [Anaerolineaceae bacterium]HQP07394.1 hypothetical protein [Anaerolineaceae bacterium]